MIDILFSGILWINALRLWGIAFLALLVFGIPAWMLASKLRWRRKDAEELARLLDIATVAESDDRDAAQEQKTALAKRVSRLKKSAAPKSTAEVIEP